MGNHQTSLSSGEETDAESDVFAYYSQLLLCPVVSIIAIHFCIVSPALTSSGFSVFRVDWPHLVTKYPLFIRSVPLLPSFHWLPLRFRRLLKINLLTYKTLREKQPVYLDSMFAASLPSRSPILNKGIGLSVSRVNTNIDARAFTLVLRLFGTSLSCLSVQPFHRAWLHRR